MSRFRALAEDLLKYGVMGGISRGVSFALLPVLTRKFSTAEYGVIDLAITVAGLVSALGGLQMPSALQRYFYEYDEEDRARFVSTLLASVAGAAGFLLLLGSVTSEPLADLLFDLGGHADVLLAGFTAAVFAALAMVPEMVLRMERRVVLYNLADLSFTVTYFCLALYFVFVLEVGVVGVLVALAAGRMLEFVVALVPVRKYLTLSLSPSVLRRTLRYSLPLVPSVAVTWANKHVDRFALVSFRGLASVGVYGAGATVTMVINLFVAVFRKAWQPFAMSLISLDTEEARNRFYRRAMQYTVGLFVVLGLTLTAVGPELVAILVPADYHQAYVVLPWLAGAAFAPAIGNITGMGTFISEKTGANTLGASLGLGSNVALALLLIPPFGITGAAIGTFMGSFIAVGIVWYFGEKHAPVQFDRTMLIELLGVYVLTGASMVAAEMLMGSGPGSMALRFVLWVVAVIFTGKRCFDTFARRQLVTAWARIRRKYSPDSAS